MLSEAMKKVCLCNCRNFWKNAKNMCLAQKSAHICSNGPRFCTFVFLKYLIQWFFFILKIGKNGPWAIFEGP